MPENALVQQENGRRGDQADTPRHMISAYQTHAAASSHRFELPAIDIHNLVGLH